LIGFDKIEITEMAEKIGTYEISILPDSDCSAAPRYPETSAELEKVIEAQKKIGMETELANVILSLNEIVLD
jgi:thiamine biosynthesis protein ThiI